ncbi:MAG: hypothetical protein M0Z87_04195 [Actinomycetota bacterium]|nr:hypothetical protein [Actinomycetota bacterium]
MGSAPAANCVTPARLTGWTVSRLAAQTIGVPVQEGNVAAVTSEVAQGAGGVVLFGSQAPADLGVQLRVLQAAAPGHLPPMVMADEEGGLVQRLANLDGSIPSESWMGANWSPAQVRAASYGMGLRMAAAGVTTDLAPVLDVDGRGGSIAQNPDATRSFGANVSVVTADGLAFASGLEAAGVTPVVKHFPGLGNATANTDLGPASTPPWAVEQGGPLAPFVAAVAAKMPAVMVSNASTPGLSTLPASISPVTEGALLGDRLGFGGLVVTDSLSASSISDIGLGVPAASVEALRAGADMVLSSVGPSQTASTTSQTISAITAAVAAGALPRSRLTDAVLHVLAAKGYLCGPASRWAVAARSQGGYWIASPDGRVSGVGAPWLGSPAASGKPVPSPVSSIVGTPDGLGYWTATGAGNVFGFGDAKWLGSPSAADQVLPSRVVAMAATRGGHGYWLATATGNVFAYGTARWCGSPAAAGLSGMVTPVVSLSPTPGGHGYWVTTATGNVYPYGTARWFGSLADRSTPLRGLVVGMAVAPAGKGYWLATSAGGVHPFGDARWLGSPSQSQPSHAGPVVAISAASTHGSNGSSTAVQAYSAFMVSPSLDFPSPTVTRY